jgi:phosphatidate cytidylyltransferase
VNAPNGSSGGEVGRPSRATDGRSRREVGGRDLPLAIVVGVLLAGIFLGSLFWHPLAFSLVITVLTALAYVEAGRVLDRVGVRLVVPVAFVATTVVLFGAYRDGHGGQVAGIALLFAGAVVWQVADKGRRDVVGTSSTTVLFGLWIGFLASYGVLLITGDIGPTAVLGVVGAAIFSDIGGYAFGVTLGRHPIAPSISPNKTWEGFLGGLAVATVLVVAVLSLTSDRFGILDAAVLAVVCGSAAFVGDLVESMVKRDLGVKDLGDLLPGHGGVLDRVDGILFAMPVGYYALELLGV